MSLTFAFCHERAEQAAADAALATLDNVRDRALRSEKSWRALADQARRVLEERGRAEEERSARRAAELAALA